MNPTSINTMNWLQTPTKKGTVKNKKIRTVKIIHPIFEDAAHYTTDKYWIESLKEASKNKFPRGFKYSQPKLICRIKNKQLQVDITTDPADVAKVYIEFLKNKGGIRSELDEERDKKYTDISLTTNYHCWNDIKKKTVRSDLINQYLQSLVTKHNLNLTQEKQLRTTVGIGLLKSHFTNDDIVFNNGYVRDIKGLEHKNNEFIIDDHHKNQTKNAKIIPTVPDKMYFSPMDPVLNIRRLEIMNLWYLFINKHLINTPTNTTSGLHFDTENLNDFVIDTTDFSTESNTYTNM